MDNKKKNNKQEQKVKKVNVEQLKTAAIIVLSLIIVFGLAFVVPELKNCNSCKEEQLDITTISMDEYRTLLKGEEASLIYLASPSCTYCQQQNPIMKSLVNEYNVTVNYVNVSDINDSEAEEIYQAYETMQIERYSIESLRTPTILIVQNNKVVDIHLGVIALEELVDLLDDYMQIEE